MADANQEDGDRNRRGPDLEQSEGPLPPIRISRTSISFREPFSPTAMRSQESTTLDKSVSSPPTSSAYARSPTLPATRRSIRVSNDLDRRTSTSKPLSSISSQSDFSQTTMVSRGSEPDPLKHRLSINPSDLPYVPKPAGQLTSETQQPRWWLQVQAVWWRTLMQIGMHIHDWAPPPPPKPSFHRYIPTLSDHGHKSPAIDLAFYVPPDFESRKRAGHRYPVVVNHHGGGFVLGSNDDDRYWFRMVLLETPCIVVSVGYRRAPEFPFPTPVDDCVDTLLYLSGHAHELGIDTSRITLSGFSAGANFTFAVPLRLKYHVSSFLRRGKSICGGIDSELQRYDSTRRLLASTNELSIISIIAFYPLVDFATPRDDKRAISLRPEKTMPKFFTNLFDQSYLPGTSGINHSSPYVSPGRASDNMLQGAIPQHIQMFLCEWDMLLREGQSFSKRLSELGKSVSETLVENHPHGWDKSPNPWRDQKAIDAYYHQACTGLNQLLANLDAGKELPGARYTSFREEDDD